MLPPKRHRDGGPYRIAVICLGNICRSPIGQVVLSEKIARAGLDGQVEVSSAGTGDWHVGGPMDRRAAAVLAGAGYDPSQHRAARFDPRSYEDLDLVLAMDENNHDDLTRLAAGAHGDRLLMFRDFDPRAGDDRNVPDPYFGGDEGFDDVLATVERTADAIVGALERELGGS